ncbi:MAG TPA: hypothetical protein VF616_19765 [Duganella sp.]|uniref:hypothetical protein n=1 Tax=Duganella sp. TaxID=1904440 RepID=UPI002ECFE27C
MSAKMKDDVMLVLTALVCAGGAWAFWHYLGAQALGALSTIALIALAADNYRLRRRLRQTPGSGPPIPHRRDRRGDTGDTDT